LASIFLIWLAWKFLLQTARAATGCMKGKCRSVSRDCYLLLDFFKNRGHTYSSASPVSKLQNCHSRDILQSILSFLGSFGSFQMHVTSTYNNIMRSSKYFTKFWMMWQNLCWVPITSSNGNWWDLAFHHLLLCLVLPMAITWYDMTFRFACSGSNPVYKAWFYLDLDELFCYAHEMQRQVTLSDFHGT
jgi:hypothetical protein